MDTGQHCCTAEQILNEIGGDECKKERREIMEAEGQENGDSVVGTQHHFSRLHNDTGLSRHKEETHMHTQRSVDLQMGSGVCKLVFFFFL